MVATARLPLRLQAETGTSLVELLVAAAAGLIVLFATISFSEVARRSQTETGNRAEALGQQRVGLERMTRELRQASTVNVTSSAIVDFQVYSASAAELRQVRYDCSQGSQCRRYEGPVGGALSSAYDPLVTGVQSAAFTPETLTASQDYVAIELWVTVPGRAHPIALGDGVHLRNKRAAS